MLKPEGRFQSLLAAPGDLLWLHETALKRVGISLLPVTVKCACVYGPSEDAPRTVVLYDVERPDVDTVPLCTIFLEG